MTSRKLIGGRVTFVPSTKRLPSGCRIVVTITLSPEMYQLLLATITRLDHLLLARTVRRHNAVTLHFTLDCHVSVFCPPYSSSSSSGTLFFLFRKSTLFFGIIDISLKINRIEIKYRQRPT